MKCFCRTIKIGLISAAFACMSIGAAGNKPVIREIDIPRVWLSEVDPLPFYRDDGEGPFPPAWPAAAVIVPMDPKWDNSAEGTLFLLAARELNEYNAVDSIASATRFATPCRLPARGLWINLSRLSGPVFILVYESGGTAGERVEVFSRVVTYPLPSPFRQGDEPQVHYFHRELDAHSRIQPYLADTNGDGTLEVLVASTITNCSGASDTPQIYDVWAWGTHSLGYVGELAAAEVEKFEGRIPL